MTPTFPKGLFEGANSRAQSVAAAKQAGRWLDGKLEKQVGAYVASVVLRDADGTERARGEGHAVEIFEAVRDALAPILRSLPPPTREELARIHTPAYLDAIAATAGRAAMLDADTFTSTRTQEIALLAAGAAIDAARHAADAGEAALALVRVEAARQCRDANVPLDADRLKEAIRGADFLLNHLATGDALAEAWSAAEQS